MPFQLVLPEQLRRAGWKVKIRDKERVEPPHVTILFKTQSWRLGLRDRSFLEPPGGRWGDLPDGVRRAVERNWEALVAAWDERYPENPVKGQSHG